MSRNSRADRIARYEELEEGRVKTASLALTRVMQLGASVVQGQVDPMDAYNEAILHDVVITASMRDAANDNAEVANLLRVVESDQFTAEVRDVARSRIVTMLGL